MGAYLSQPKTDKVSTDELNELLRVGASSMQGWRNTQEDAHNAILNFDTNTSFFAVYDGHGGAEVATYCADRLPQFLKDLEAYKNGDFEKALRDAFLGFDRTLLEPKVVEILKLLAGEKNMSDPDDSDAMDDDEDLAELHEESNLPLNEVLEKYKGGPSMPALKRVKDGAGGSSKPQSPYLRGRRAAAVAADAANKAVMDPDAKPQGSSTSAAAAAAAASAGSSNDAGPSSSKSSVSKMDTDEPEEDSTVSSSSSSKSNNNNSTPAVGTEAEAATSDTQKITTNGSPAASSTAPTISTTSPDSSHVKESDQNGSVTSSVNKAAAAAKADVSTSSASTVPVAIVAPVVKSTADDGAVSGSADAAKRIQNGSIGSTSSTSSKSPVVSAAADGPSSTSKEAKKVKKAALGEDDSTDDDADYNAENANADENDPRHALEYSSEEDIDDDDDEDDDDGDDEDDDDDEEEDEDEDEDEESALANEQFCANMIEEPGQDSGCTAVVALLQGRDLYVANAGDSRCVVCRNGRTIDMSLDHKPEDDEESARIIKAGGRVTLDGRVNGGLNLSRAIGDHAYKMTAELPAEEQMISALPDIKKLIITPEDEFLVLACDGIWNYMSSEEVVQFVRLRLKDESKEISQICEELFDNCLAPNTIGDGTGCDNMTAVIVRFKPKLLELPTKINPDQTEDISFASMMQKNLKRSASPTSEDNSNEVENANKTKRLKTDEEKSSSNNGDAEAASSCTSSAPKAEEKECDSVTNATSETVAVSST